MKYYSLKYYSLNYNILNYRVIIFTDFVHCKNAIFINMNNFVDRKKELTFLNDEYKRKGSSFVVLYGRRRNGKTTLIKKYLENKNGIYFLATEENDEVNKASLLRLVLNKYPSKYELKINTWEDIFKYIVDNDKKPVIVIDEFQYLGMVNQAFPSIFQKIWDNILKDTNAKVIICGSLVNMMYSQALNYSSPLYGRRTGQIRLSQVDYEWTKYFYKKANEKQLMEYYAVTGGVPRYIEIFKDSYNLYDAIEKNILDKNSLLYLEPEFILKKEVKEIGNYFSIIRAIAEGARKISEISIKLNMTQTSITFYLNTLQELDLVKREVPITERNNAKSKKGLYKINDNFICFWFKFVYPYKDFLEIGNTAYVRNVIEKKFVENHMSYVYEDICREKLFKKYTKKINKIGKWWDKNNEIDIVGVNDDEKYVVCAECKYKSKKVGVDVLNSLIDKSDKINEYKNYKKEYVIYSLSGFDSKLLKIAKQMKNVKLEIVGN